MTTMFFRISSSGYHSNKFDGLFLVQLLIIMTAQHVSFYFQSILDIFIFYSTFPEGKKAGRFFLFLAHSQVTWSASHTFTCWKLWEAWELALSVHPQVTWSTSICSELWEVWELPLSVPFVFMALPLEGKPNGMDNFGLWEGLPSPWRGLENSHWIFNKSIFWYRVIKWYMTWVEIFT